MENRDEKRKMAEKALFEILFKVGFNIFILAEFIEAWDNKRRFIEKDLLGGVSDSYRRGADGRIDIILRNTHIMLLNTILSAKAFDMRHDVDGYDDLHNLKTSSGYIDLSRKDARVIASYLMQLLVCDDKKPSKLHIEAYLSIVKALKNELEVMKMDLHLAGESVYNKKIRQAESFVKAMEVGFTLNKSVKA